MTQSTIAFTTTVYVYAICFSDFNGARIVTYFSVFKLLFALRVSTSAAAPESPIPICSRLQVVKINL